MHIREPGIVGLLFFGKQRRDTGKAYLVGLAATDDPASLGTEMLTFSASAAHNP
ncbi:GPO family capsid scaffolding protein, partial [Escherichia coli]|uniref:GPO family capsid scaffolding protein n=1 Tax=Escherichia coli TaxID=562 RepID=UPI003EDFA68D